MQSTIVNAVDNPQSSRQSSIHNSDRQSPIHNPDRQSAIVSRQ
jgi:hypothetical protein